MWFLKLELYWLNVIMFFIPNKLIQHSKPSRILSLSISPPFGPLSSGYLSFEKIIKHDTIFFYACWGFLIDL